MLPSYWILWGLGFIFLPRMTIGLLLMFYLGYHDIGLILTIIGFILDFSSGRSD